MQRTLVVYGDKALGNAIAGVFINRKIEDLQNKLAQETERANRNSDFRHMKTNKSIAKLREKYAPKEEPKIKQAFEMLMCILFVSIPEYIEYRYRYAKHRMKKYSKCKRRNHH